MSVIVEQMVESLKINKSTWKLTKFGEVAIQQKKNVNRDDTHLTKYVKGEHMYSQDLHLREWGELTDEYLGPAFIRYFDAGDILYGSRRTYLRKVVIAPFEGITSNTTFVIKANEEKIDKRLLAFVMMTDEFSEHSIRNSKGSVNPYINWKDIANFEFLLPPIEEQKKLAELLLAMDNVIEKEKRLLIKLDEMRLSFEKMHFFNQNDKISHNYKVYKLSEIADISGGSTPSRDVPEYWNGDIPWLTPTDVTNHNTIELDKTKEYITSEGLKKISNRIYPVGSILYCSRATIGYAIINEVPMATNQGFSNFITNEKAHNYYLYFLLRHSKNALTKLASGSTFLEIAKSSIRNFKVGIPNLNEQREVADKLLLIEKNRLTIQQKINSSKILQKSLILQIF